MSQVSRISRNNTTQSVNADGSKSVTLHSTVVIQWWPNSRKVKLYTGGYNTNTTRNRMNQALNAWHIPASVSFASASAGVWLNGETLPFQGNACVFTY